MRRNGNDVGIDASFTIDPDDCGNDNVVERDGYKVSGCSGYLGVILEIPPDNWEGIPAGTYRMDYDSWCEEGEEDEDRLHYQTLANVIEFAQDAPRDFIEFCEEAGDDA